MQVLVGIAELLLGFWSAGNFGREAVLLVVWVGAAALARGVMEITLAVHLHGLRTDATRGNPCRPDGTMALELPPNTTARRNSTSGEPAKRQVGVLTVDDQEVFRELARQVVEATPGFEPLGEVASGEEALPAVDDLNPDLVVMDVRMPGMDGIETARRIAAAHPETVVVLISVEDPMDIPSAAETSGAVALVRKEDFKPALLVELWAAHGRVQR